MQVYSDSSILVEQLGGLAKPCVERLESLYAAARVLLESFGEVQLQWIPRHRNGEADALARAALGALPKPSVHPSLRGLPRKKRRSPPPLPG